MNKETVNTHKDLGKAFIGAVGSNSQNESTKRKPQKHNKAITYPRITLRLSHEEHDRLKDLSQGITISAYVRQCVFGENATRRKRRSYQPVEDQASLGKVLALLGETRIANNLNQLAHQANMGSLEVNDVTLEKIETAYNHINAMRQTLIEALGLIEKS